MKRGIFGLIAAGLVLAMGTFPLAGDARSPYAANLGKMVNSEGSDFAPVISADGNYLYFTSNREGGEGGQDIWVSHLVDGAWTRPSNLGTPINSAGNEGPDCFVDDGDKKFLYMTLCLPAKEGLCDIYTSDLNDDGTWTEPRPVGDPINSAYSDANASWDYVNKVLYFSSTRPGGIPGEGPKRLPNEVSYDIWMCPMNDDGSWGEAMPLGPPINTPDWEGVAFFHAADQMLYFSSNGHGGQGGADIFKAEKIGPASFGEPEPVEVVNSPANDIYFSIPAAGDFAYYSSNDAEGLGNEDVYSVPLYLILEPEMIALRTTGFPVAQKEPTRVMASHVETIYFNFDRSSLLTPEQKKLDKVADFMIANPNVDIEISGHADSVGDVDYNLLLSKNRADSVFKYLKKKGVDADRVKVDYHGEAKPAVDNDPRYGNPLNRRVEISIR